MLQGLAGEELCTRYIFMHLELKLLKTLQVVALNFTVSSDALIVGGLGLFELVGHYWGVCSACKPAVGSGAETFPLLVDRAYAHGDYCTNVGLVDADCLPCTSLAPSSNAWRARSFWFIYLLSPTTRGRCLCHARSFGVIQHRLESIHQAVVDLQHPS